MATEQALTNEFKQKMLRTFETIDLGLLHYLLRLEDIQIEEDVFVSQKKYAKDILKRFSM